MNIAAQRALQSALEPHLGAIADLLPSCYKVTLVARYTGVSDADIILTNDHDLGASASVRNKYAETEKVKA